MNIMQKKKKKNFDFFKKERTRFLQDLSTLVLEIAVKMKFPSSFVFRRIRRRNKRRRIRKKTGKTFNAD